MRFVLFLFFIVYPIAANSFAAAERTLLVSESATSGQERVRQIRVSAPASEGHLSQRYFVALLKLIATRANVARPDLPSLAIVEVTLNGEEVREDVLLTRGFLDIIWAGSNDELEKRLLPVKLPIVGGLLGYRLALVRKDKLDWFNGLSVAEIKKLDACQGEFWTDSDILEANGFNVKRANSFDAMPRMLLQGRCDYFPRGLHEAYIDAKNLARQYPEFTIAEQRIFKYQLAAFMFLKPGEDTIAGRLEEGFKLAMEDGSVANLRYQSDLFQPVFPLEKWAGSRFIELDNPFFATGEKQEIPAQYWLNLENPILAKHE